MTAATDLTVAEAQENWPKRSSWFATAVITVVLTPAAIILAVWHAIEHHPGSLGRWLAEYTAGFAALCIVAGAGMKYAGDRLDRRTDSAYEAALAAGADEEEIFDILHYGPPAPSTSKLHTAVSTIAVLALLTTACWGLEHLAS